MTGKSREKRGFGQAATNLPDAVYGIQRRKIESLASQLNLTTILAAEFSALQVVILVFFGKPFFCLSQTFTHRCVVPPLPQAGEGPDKGRGWAESSQQVWLRLGLARSSHQLFRGVP
jgi:hypothetical protein